MTLNWEMFVDESLLASVLPQSHSHFARPIRDGLSLFLSGLPESQQASILAAQAALPTTTSFSQRLGVLARSSPTLQKLGQVLGRDRRLPEDLRCCLRQLESLPPSIPIEIIRETLIEELGPLERRGITLLPPAIAEASVAVVVPFRQKSRVNNSLPANGVFKVLKPGIEATLAAELNLLQRVGAHLDSRCDDLQIPHLDYEESFQQVHDKLMDEVRLEHEQRHMAEASQFFADESRVVIPRLLEHCTSRVTAMEQIFGHKVTDHGADSSRQRRRLARLIARNLIAKPIFSTADAPLFHGDPHAGNMFFTDDGRLAILDWSLAGKLSVSARVAIVQIVLAAITLDADRIVSALIALDEQQRLDVVLVRQVLESWLRRIRHGQFPGLNWLTGLLDVLTQTARLRVSSDLMLFRKSLLTLDGVCADVGESEGQISRALTIEFVRRFAAEWPERWIRPPDSKQFSTRLSNIDLTRVLLSGPSAFVRFWTGHSLEMIDAGLARFEKILHRDTDSAIRTTEHRGKSLTTIAQE